jgi:type II secretory pathway component PulC
MYKILKGNESYGFAYRSQGNLEHLKQSADAVLKERGVLKVYCLNDTIENCKGNVLYTMRNSIMIDSQALSDSIFQLTFK